MQGRTVHSLQIRLKKKTLLKLFRSAARKFKEQYIHNTQCDKQYTIHIQNIQQSTEKILIISHEGLKIEIERLI